MGFWQGAASAYQGQLDKKHVSEEKAKDRELRKDESDTNFARQKKLIDYRSKAEARQEAMLSGLTAARGGGDDSGKLVNALAGLKAMGVNDEMMAKIKTGNTDGIVGLYGELRNLHKERSKYDQGQSFLSNINTLLASNLTIVPGELFEYDFGDGEVLEGTTPTGIGLTPSNPTQYPDLEDLTRVETMVIERMAPLAEREQQKISTTSSSISRDLTKNTIPPEWVGVAEAASNILRERDMLVTGMREQAKEGDATQLFDNYGRTAIDGVLKSAPNVKLEALGPAFQPSDKRVEQLNFSGYSPEQVSAIKTLLTNYGWSFDESE